MNSPVLPPPAPKKERKKAPLLIGWLSEIPERRSVQIGVLASIVLNLVALLVIPILFKPEPLPPGQKRKPAPFNIRIAPQFMKKPQPKVPVKQLPKFVEANPNAPENTPDKTNNVSDRNQQVAQEKPTPNGKSDMPALQGRKDVQSTQIVDGRLQRPQETPTPPEPVQQPQPKVAQQTPQRREQDTLSGFDKSLGKNAAGFGSNIAPKSDNPTAIPNKIEGTKDGAMTPLAYTQVNIDRSHPKQRQSLDVHARPAIFKDNPFGTSNIGPVALDSRWSNYGVYMKRLIETVQAEWDGILLAAKEYPKPGSTVTITFILNSKGQIQKVVHVDSSPGTSDFGSRACGSALTNPSPYQPWTDDMIAVLGTEQQMTFTFYYE